MKKQNNIILLLIASFTIFNINSFGETKNNQVSFSKHLSTLPNDGNRIMIRIYESFGNMLQSSQIIITTGEQTEIIELKAAKTSNREENDKVIFKTLQKYFNAGYKIENSTATGAPETYTVITYILINN
ncbi:MAG: hypothetical protein K1X82_13595 [Bacteroidia bacterium]|nr:hypothetical protein [Bacteroidia bacterium]